MCQPTTHQPPRQVSCPTIKANARLRRSRQWKDNQAENDPNAGNNNKSPKKNAQRRRRRPTRKELAIKQSASSDCDTASTASTEQLSSDDSFSGSSCNAPTKHGKKCTKSPRRKRTKKGKQSRPKIVNIVPDITDEEKARYLALDAEMVGIGPNGYTSRLARVSLVNWEGEVVYDTLVKVTETVTDYRTFVSGITAEDLESDEAVSFDEAQSKVAELIEDRIVVGHGLKNDFKVLGLSHPWHLVRDTAKYEPFMRSVDPSEIPPNATPLISGGLTYVPKKLRVLAKDKLGMMIQEEGKPHSPVEDAVAALELYKKHRGKWERAMEYKVERTRAIMGSSAQ